MQARRLTDEEQFALLPLDDETELTSEAFIPVRVAQGGARVWAQTRDGREYFTVFGWEPLRNARLG